MKILHKLPTILTCVCMAYWGLSLAYYVDNTADTSTILFGAGVWVLVGLTVIRDVVITRDKR